MNVKMESFSEFFGKNRKFDVPGDTKVAQRYRFINQHVGNAMHIPLVSDMDSSYPFRKCSVVVPEIAWGCMNPC